MQHPVEKITNLIAVFGSEPPESPAHSLHRVGRPQLSAALELTSSMFVIGLMF